MTALLLAALLQEMTFAQANDFCVQARDVDLAALGKTKYDLVIIDHSRDFPNGATYVPDDYAALRNSPGGPKLAVAYLSIGRAQSSRYYWKPEWTATPPAWLGPKDPARGDSFQAKHWEIDWQRIVQGYVDRLIDAGYDGALLGGIDGYVYWQNQGEAGSREKMITFVQELTLYARKRSGRFVVLTSGGEELLADGRWLAAIDGIVRSEAYLDGAARRAEAETKVIEGNLALAARAGKKVLILEATDRPAEADRIYARAKELGFLAYCGPPGFASLAQWATHQPD